MLFKILSEGKHQKFIFVMRNLYFPLYPPRILFPFTVMRMGWRPKSLAMKERERDEIRRDYRVESNIWNSREGKARLYLFTLLPQVQDQREKSLWIFKNWAGVPSLAVWAGLSISPCLWGKRGEHVRSPCTKFRRNSGIHTPAVSPFCLFSFSYSFPELQNLPFQPVQLKFAGKHNLGNPKGPVGPIQAFFTPNPRARF